MNARLSILLLVLQCSGCAMMNYPATPPVQQDSETARHEAAMAEQAAFDKKWGRISDEEYNAKIKASNEAYAAEEAKRHGSAYLALHPETPEATKHAILAHKFEIGMTWEQVNAASWGPLKHERSTHDANGSSPE